ncbi:MAG: hypothetical protein J6H31_08250 [Butyrivibrio sp.]|nr:hypothetical protein [Butyrivibrio sp.]
MSIICVGCCKENLSIDEIGVNKKLLGESVSEYYCMDCLAEYLEVSVEDLEDKIEEFKEQGCTLFE